MSPITKGIVHSADQCLRKSIPGVLSSLLLSREYKADIAHKWEVTPSSGHKEQGREQHALLKSQLCGWSLVMAVHEADCKSEIFSNTRASLFSPFLSFNSTKTAETTPRTCMFSSLLSDIALVTSYFWVLTFSLSLWHFPKSSFLSLLVLIFCGQRQVNFSFTFLKREETQHRSLEQFFE